MTDFIVKGPSLETVTGTDGIDRLTYKLVSGPGGVLLELPTPNVDGGYDGVFQPEGGDPTTFTAIEHITFVDKVGGADDISTAGGDDILRGGGGHDLLSSGAGFDTLYGGALSDKLYGGGGGDTLYGGTGNDRLFGEAGHDSLFGDRGADVIRGGAGNDFIDGGAGDDKMFGGFGDDFIIADSGADVVDAGKGDDMVEVSFDAIKTIDGGDDRDMLVAFFGDFEQGDMRLVFNMITGRFEDRDSDLNATSTATNFEDFSMQGEIDAKVVGTDGANQIFGGLGDDFLRGNGGRDALFGEGGDDILLGNKHADVLNGGAGDDIMTGGAGTDTFIFAGGADTITDFNNDVDTIQVLGGLVPLGTTAQDLIDSATVVGGNTVIALSAEHILTIEGLTDPTLLSDDLLIG